MFNLLNDVVDMATQTVSDAVDIGLATVTLGEYGELSTENVSRLLATGLTVYELSELTGVTVDVIQSVVDD